jgi:chemotaxis response regulator CheB
VLSGSGTDGTLGLMAIKQHGGMTMAQAPASARYDSMPRSAVQNAVSIAGLLLTTEALIADIPEAASGGGGGGMDGMGGMDF